MKARTAKTNTLRIIAGEWRNRKLSFPDAPGLRPTTDRIRETVFNWLQHYVAGAHCLDLFAGSGAMGLEALSRGAAHVDFVETSLAAKKQLNDHLTTLKTSDGQVWHTDALSYLHQCKTAYDVVFLDPPYDARLLEASIKTLLELHLLKPDARIFLEDNQPLQALCEQSGLTLLKDKKAGNVYYGLAINVIA